jgi:hypothetical protein
VGSIEWFDFFVSKKRPKKSKIKIALSKKISGKIAKKSFSNKSRKFTFILDILLRGTDQMVRRIGYEVTDSLDRLRRFETTYPFHRRINRWTESVTKIN